MNETKTIMHRWKQAPSIRRTSLWNNVSVDSIVAYGIRDDGKICQESMTIDVCEDDEELPKIEKIKASLLSKLESHLTETNIHSWKREPRYRVFSDISNPIMDTLVLFAIRDDDVLLKETGTFDYCDSDEMRDLIKILLLKLNEHLSDREVA